MHPGAVAAPPGLPWRRAWTDAVDAALAGWLGDRRSGTGVAVVALGSYARRELCPRSDVDLLLLHDGKPSGDLEELVRLLCYPLWDAGLSVGHAVRTPRQAVAAMRQRVDTATALTDRRLVVGDPGLADSLASLVTRWLRRNGGRLLSELAAGAAARHEREGAHPGMLEPDLKTSPGGLRDLHALRWAAACVLGEASIDRLVGARYVSAVERRQLAEAGAALLDARCALHATQARSGDVLRLDLQDDVADRLGLAGGGDALLRRVGMAMRTVAHVHGRAFRTLLDDARGGRRRSRPAPVPAADGVALVDGFVETDEERRLAADPGLGMRAVAAAAAHGTHLGRKTCERLARDAAAAGTLPWDAATVDDLLAALARGRDGLPALRDADHVGLIDAYLPHWGRVRGRRQRNPYHRLDLDTHLLVTVAWLRDIVEGALGDGPRRVWERLEDPGALLLGALLHDVGKAWPGDHSEVGRTVACGWLARMGVGERRRRHVATLIGEHLLLPDVATRRDIDEEAEIVAVAERAGSVELLDGLYLLSLADGRATGPSAHSPWKEELLGTLHSRAAAVLTDDAAGRAVLEPAVVVAQARRLAGPDRARAAALDTLLEGVPRRYLLAATPEQCLAHADLLAAWRDGRTPAVAFEAGAVPGTGVVSVVATDRRGLVADCAGLLAARGLHVAEARAFTRPAGADLPALALDWFVVDAAPPEVGGLLADLGRAASGEADVAAALGARERRRGGRSRALPETVAVDVRIQHDGDAGRIEVHGPDAPGLLYRLARVLADAGVDVTGARVATLSPAVRDVFFVRLPAGVDPAVLERRLRAAAGAPGQG